MATEIRPLHIDDLDMCPPCFQNENDGYAILAKAAHYVQFFIKGHDRPIYYMRNINPDSQRWAGIIELGEGPLSLQKGLHGQDLAQDNAKTVPYRVLCNKPKTYVIESLEPYSRLSFMEDEQYGIVCHIQEGKEGCILDIKMYPMPFAFISHADKNKPIPHFQVNTYVSGTYMGKPIEGMGGFDRTFIIPNRSNKATQDSYKKLYRCTCALYSGRRKDGRFEFVNAKITDKNGEGIGIYYIDGEKPYISNNVFLEASYTRLPYVNDDTATYKNAVWHLGDKEIHFIGKWGTKGFTFEPKLQKHGQSQVFGIWYEGSMPYEHEISHGFNENTGDAYLKRFKSMGFNIE